MSYNPRIGARSYRLYHMEEGKVCIFPLDIIDSVKSTITRLHRNTDRRYSTRQTGKRFRVTRVK